MHDRHPRHREHSLSKNKEEKTCIWRIMVWSIITRVGCNSPSVIHKPFASELHGLFLKKMKGPCGGVGSWMN